MNMLSQRSRTGHFPMDFSRWCAGTVFALAALCVQGQTYYISSSGGNDANNGTSSSTPWKTLAKANQNMANGITVRLKADDVFRGTLYAQGVSGISVTSYGNGNRPVIAQSRSIADNTWTEVSSPYDNVYSTPLVLGAGQKVKQFYLGGQRKTLARHPSTGWARNDAGSSGNTLLDSDRTESNDHWNGSEVVMRTFNWSYNLFQVLDSEPGELTLSADQSNTAGIGGWGYFLQNKYGPQDVADLQARLLEISPFVSTAALQALVEQPVVADTVKLEVCAANPDATRTGGFVQWAETAALQPMEQDGTAALASTWNTTTARTAMEDQLAQRHSALTLAVHQYLHGLHGDTAIAAPDSLRWAWQHLRTTAARYAEATAVVEAMPQERLLSGREEAERGRMLTYIDVLQGAMEEGRDPFQLSATEVQTLLDMVGTHYDRPSVWASNLLCMAYGHCRAPYTGGSGSSAEVRSTPQAGASPLPTTLRLHPNPANGLVDMDYLLPGHTGAVYLVVRDAAGRVLHRYATSGQQGRHSWDTRGLAPGLYLVELHGDGGVERTERLYHFAIQ